jgi:phosphoenolpyruvate synthase/pyruvate phosphate dikinase
VRGDRELIEAIKVVWASLWNFEAYEAREQAGVDHSKVFMAVLVQEGVNAESAGVMITTDPYDRENRDATYISAKRGLGIRVVEGEKIAEQIIFRPQSNAVQVLTRSAEDSLLTFDDQGGVREIAITGERRVLTDAVIRRLARSAAQIKRIFKGREQDIEWVYSDGQVYIVQSRPYIAGN